MSFFRDSPIINCRDSPSSIRHQDTINLSTREKQVYGQLWAATGAEQYGFITGAEAVHFFAKSGLPSQTLREIWALADSGNKGVLGPHGFSVAVRLIAHAQNGEGPSLKLISTVAPAPHFEGISSPKTSDSSPPSSSVLTSVTSHSTEPEAIISDKDKAKYATMFSACKPVNGLLAGDDGRKVFEKSKLPLDKLALIWNLADIMQRGSLNLTEFTIAMYYIRLSMEGKIKTLPEKVPPSLYDSCNRPLSVTGSTSVNKTDNTRPEPQLTGHSGSTRSSLQSYQFTGQRKDDTSSCRQGGSSDRDVPWDVSPEEKAKFDQYFEQLDINHDGFVEGHMAVPFFMESKQPDAVLARIWDLVDITKSGRLSKDEFAVAMHLIYRNNSFSSGNVQIPETLPISLIPPSLRATQVPALPICKPSIQDAEFFSSEDRKTEAEMSPRVFTPKVVVDSIGSTGSLAHKQQPPQSLNLYDLPLTGTSPYSSSSPQNNKTRTVQTDNGARDNESNILDTKLYQESKAVKGLQTERAQLEERMAQSQDMREMMEQRLRNLKAQKERESKAVETMKFSMATMESELSSLRMAIDVSKRELEVAQANKSSFLTALTNGQEESLELKVTLQKNRDEVLKLRLDLETRMRMLGLDPLDFPGAPERGTSAHTTTNGAADVQNGRVTRGPQFVMDELSVTSSLPRTRNPEFRGTEPVQGGSRGPQDHHGDFQGPGMSKTIPSQPWHLLAQQESLSREQ